MENLFDLTGKSVLVAGGSGLIGTAIIQVCRQLHAEVKNIDIKEGHRLNTYDQSTNFLFNDKGNLYDVFINTIHPDNPNEHLDIFMYYTEKVADLMMEKKVKGSIINLASIYSVVGYNYRIYEGSKVPYPSPRYAGYKGGIVSFSRVIATDYAEKGIRINCVSPGGVYDANRHCSNFESSYSYETPMGRMATPEDIAWPVAFLASDASKYITGQNIVVDGGWTAW